MVSPKKIELVGDYLAIQWVKGGEAFIDVKTLRENSPSSENKGETDIFGNLSKKTHPSSKAAVKILKFEKVGNYAIRILYSDGHSTGIYDWKLLEELSQIPESTN